PTDDELRDRLAVIRLAAAHYVGVGEWEHLLVDLLRVLQSDRVPRARGVQFAVSLVAELWEQGTPELLEFTMRTLQWPEVQEALQTHTESDADFRTRDLASSVLEVYGPEWPNGEIYRTYRAASA
ncbi:MAG TPA: hypothetical protein VFK41_05325, partial [Nocardioidaceae bacterium]|nr:hypothetical protein [Nocardioidaceae bacterium]